MADLEFEWDPAKERANRGKHGISFEEAKTVFYDDGALVASDPDHSAREDRFLIIRYSIVANLLLVCFCERGHGDVIRIISARRAAPGERRRYLEGGLA